MEQHVQNQMSGMPTLVELADVFGFLHPPAVVAWQHGAAVLSTVTSQQKCPGFKSTSWLRPSCVVCMFSSCQLPRIVQRQHKSSVGVTLSVNACLSLCISLRQTGNFSNMYPLSHPIKSEMDSSPSVILNWKSGGKWMNGIKAYDLLGIIIV